MKPEWLTTRTPDGRELEVMRHGPRGALPLVLHVGTPSAPVEYPQWSNPVIERGWRIVAYARPGYAGSLRDRCDLARRPRGVPGRSGRRHGERDPRAGGRVVRRPRREADRRALTGDIAEGVADGVRHAVLRGTAGWFDDDISLVAQLPRILDELVSRTGA